MIKCPKIKKKKNQKVNMHWQWSSRWKTICNVLSVSSSIKTESLVYNSSLALKQTDSASSDFPILSKMRALSAYRTIKGKINDGTPLKAVTF